jgi:O-antigen/teichoic acid export membrane protein
MSSRFSEGFNSDDEAASSPGSRHESTPVRREGMRSGEARATDAPIGQDILDSPRAGARVIQGAAVRSAGYFAGIALALLSAPLLTRHLGVTDYGSYVVIVSLIVIATIFADAGMTAAGVKEYSVRDADGRTRLLQNLVSARLAASALAGAGAVLFAFTAGYAPILVAGAALGAVGLVLTIAQRTYAIPLAVALRLELTTALDLLRQALTVAGIIALVIAGAGLSAFFVLPIPVALVVLVATLVIVKEYGTIRPTVNREESLLILGEVPAAAAAMLGALFYRVAIIMMSLLATSQQTGYFGLSLGVADVFIPVATLIAGSAFPILARAADTDRHRLGNAFRQLFDVSVIVGIGSAFILVAGAEPIVAFLGGAEFEPTVPVLRIQGLAVAATFLVTLFGYMLWVVRARRQLIVCNLFGLGAAVVLTATLIPVWEAKGAALAMLIAESLLAAWLGIALLSGRADLRPQLRTVAKAIVAVAVAGCIALAPIPPLGGVILGTAAYLIVLLVLRAIPLDIWRATFGAWRAS